MRFANHHLLILLFASLSVAARLDIRAPEWSELFKGLKTKGVTRQNELNNLQPDKDQNADCVLEEWFTQNLGASKADARLKPTLRSMDLSLTDEKYWTINMYWPKNPQNPQAQPDTKTSAFYGNIYNPGQQLIVADSIAKPRELSNVAFWSDVTWSVWKQIPDNNDPGNLKYILHKNVQSEDGRPLLEEIFNNIPKKQWGTVQTWQPTDDQYLALLGCTNGGTVKSLVTTHTGPLKMKTVKSVSAIARGSGSSVEFVAWWTLG